MHVLLTFGDCKGDMSFASVSRAPKRKHAKQREKAKPAVHLLCTAGDNAKYVLSITLEVMHL